MAASRLLAGLRLTLRLLLVGRPSRPPPRTGTRSPSAQAVGEGLVLAATAPAQPERGLACDVLARSARGASTSSMAPSGASTARGPFGRTVIFSLSHRRLQNCTPKLIFLNISAPTDRLHPTSQYAAFQIPDLAESGLAQKIHSIGGALAASAMRHDFTRAIQFAHALRQIAERNQIAIEIADLIFVRLAHVEDKQIVAAVQALLQFSRASFPERR